MDELTVKVFVVPDVPTVNGVSTLLTVKPLGDELTENVFIVELPESVDIVTLTVLVVPASAVVESNDGSLTVTAASTDGIKKIVARIQKIANLKVFIQSLLKYLPSAGQIFYRACEQVFLHAC